MGMSEPAALAADTPTWRCVAGVRVVKLRQFSGDTTAAAAARDQGLTWPDHVGEVCGRGPWLARCSPRETLAVGLEPGLAKGFAERLAPGLAATAVAVDLTEAVAVYELQGPHIDDWLARLVDSTAVPREAGRCARCRLADVSVVLLRLHASQLWLLAESPVAPYVEDWLDYAHAGAFSVPSV